MRRLKRIQLASFDSSFEDHNMPNFSAMKAKPVDDLFLLEPPEGLNSS